MKQLDLVIHNHTGLHARPARAFVDLAKQFQSTIKIGSSAKQVNAKSLIAVLTLGVKTGQPIRIEADGADEDAALEALAAAVNSGLGEEIGINGNGHAAAEATPPPASGNGHAAETAATAVSASGTEREMIVQGGYHRITGVAGAPGIALGPIYQFRRAEIVVREQAGSAAAEQSRLRAALDEAASQLVALHEQMVLRADETEAGIFEVHRELLSDPDLLELVGQKIAAGQSAGQAWQAAIAEHAAMLAGVSNPLLAERAVDVRDVGQRVLRLLVGAPQAASQPTEPCILVGYDLTPSETAALDPARVLGFCTAVGGPNAHTAILARALGLPAIVSAGAHVLDIADGTTAILDGQAGRLTLAPDATEIASAQTAMEQLRAARAAAAQAAAEPATTTDGHRVEIVANIGGLDDARAAAANGAEGVGLLRTEFLFLERTTAPTEEEQFAVYRDIAVALVGQPVIVRTLDIGGDKPLPYLKLPAEENPFLGERGIRLCLAHPDLMRQQLRAILRASTFGKLRIMFPMIADIGELRAARAVIDELRLEIDCPPPEIGIMIEVPSAALMADVLAAEVDFFSIGTNDLTQYTLAMDRGHPTLATQADGLHPAVLRLIDRTVQAAHAKGKWVGVCGELGSDPVAVPILVGLGVDELSISVPAIPTVKAQIRALALADARMGAERALACATAKEVRGGATQ